MPRRAKGFVFLATGYKARCHLRVSCSSGPCGKPGPCSPGGFSPRCSTAFFQPCLDVWLLLISHFQKGMWKIGMSFLLWLQAPLASPFCTAKHLSWGWTCTGSHRCDERWPFASPQSSVGLQWSQNRRSNSLKSHPGPALSFFSPLSELWILRLLTPGSNKKL